MVNYLEATGGRGGRPKELPPITGVFVGLTLCLPFWAIVAIVLA